MFLQAWADHETFVRATLYSFDDFFHLTKSLICLWILLKKCCFFIIAMFSPFNYYLSFGVRRIQIAHLDYKQSEQNSISLVFHAAGVSKTFFSFRKLISSQKSWPEEGNLLSIWFMMLFVDKSKSIQYFFPNTFFIKLKSKNSFYSLSPPSQTTNRRKITYEGQPKFQKVIFSGYKTSAQNEI